MMKSRKSLLVHAMAGALAVALLCGGAQFARAQGNNGSDGDAFVPYESAPEPA